VNGKLVGLMKSLDRFYGPEPKMIEYIENTAVLLMNDAAMSFINSVRASQTPSE